MASIGSTRKFPAGSRREPGHQARTASIAFVIAVAAGDIDSRAQQVHAGCGHRRSRHRDPHAGPIRPRSSWSNR